jgi:tryptophan-rich sensory protein
MVALLAAMVWTVIGFVLGIVSTVVYYERREREAAEGRAAACRLCEVTGARK